jgi:hypothetical protein
LPITASPATVGSSGSILNASAKGGAWRTKPAETAVSRSLPAWPLRDGAFSGTPGGSALAAYPREVARCEQGVLHECGLAQVGFGATCSPPFLHLSVSSLVNLVRATAAHAPFRAAKLLTGRRGGNSIRISESPHPREVGPVQRTIYPAEYSRIDRITFGGKTRRTATRSRSRPSDS